MTSSIAVKHPLFARLYASQSHKAEAKGIAEQRERLLAGLSGTVVEIGAGNGLNFAHSLATLQHGLDVIWPRFAGGCHLGRDTGARLSDAGFQIERIERFTFGIPPLDPPKPHILGLARRLDGRA